MPTNRDGKPAEQDSPPTPLSRTIKNVVKVASGGTFVTALIASGVLSLVVAIMGIILVGILTVAAIAVLKGDGEPSPFDRLMCLLGMLLGRPATRFLPNRIANRSHQRHTPAIPLQASRQALEDRGEGELYKDNAA